MDEGTITKVLVFGVLLVLGVIESFGGLYWNDRRTKNDFTIEVLGLLLLPTFIQPGIFLIVLWISGALVPNLGDILIDSSVFLQIAAFLVFDDMTQYWWQRVSHVYRKMWKLHRPHHVVY